MFGYEGQPSWIVVTLEPSAGEEIPFRVRAVTRDGRYIDLGDAILGGDDQVWGGQVPVDLSTLRELRFVGPDDRTTFTATFGSTDPWE